MENKRKMVLKQPTKKNPKYKLRKLSIGVVSFMCGYAIFFGAGSDVHAEEMSTTESAVIATINKESSPSPVAGGDVHTNEIASSENTGDSNINKEGENAPVASQPKTEADKETTTDKKDETNIYNVATFDEFEKAYKKIYENTSDANYTINITGDINLPKTVNDSSRVKFLFNKNTTILGNGHTIYFDTDNAEPRLASVGDRTLSLGKKDNLEASKLKITTNSAYKPSTPISIGTNGSTISRGTVNMYDGVEITGFKSLGTSFGSVVYIANGTFNMYGGDIHHNINEAYTSAGGAVAGYKLNETTINFNMYGGSIRDNITQTKEQYSYGGGVYLQGGNFKMLGGSIKNNTIVSSSKNAVTCGGGIFLSSLESEAIFEGGEILNNSSQNYGNGGGLYIDDSSATIKKGLLIKGNIAASGGGINFQGTNKSTLTIASEISGNTAHFGGGIYIEGKGSQLIIEKGSLISGNKAESGGGICNNEGQVRVKEVAVLANNIAVSEGDDISNYDGSLTLAPANKMETLLIKDGTEKTINGWYLDGADARWSKNNIKEQDVSAHISGTVFLKAAHDFRSTVRFMKGNDQYAKVSVNDGESIAPNLMPKDPQKEGYIFKGWTSQIDGKDRDFTDKTIINNNMTVYAIWEEIRVNNTANSKRPNIDDSINDMNPNTDNSGNTTKPNTDNTENTTKPSEGSERPNSEPKPNASTNNNDSKQEASANKDNSEIRSRSGNKLPQTGDTTDVGMYAGLAGLSLLGIFAGFKRRKEEETE